MVGSVNNGIQSAYVNAYQKRAEETTKREDTRGTESDKAVDFSSTREKEEKEQVRASNDSNASQDERKGSSRRGSLVDVTV